MTDLRQSALVALGANLPQEGQDPRVTLEKALSDLAAAGAVPMLTSRMYRTPCFPKGAGPDYVNAAAALTVPPGWDAARLLALLHEVEHRHGRTRETRWGMRTLDLDLIAMGDWVLPDLPTWTQWHDLPLTEQARSAPDRLILPHPRLQDRAFVLVPLADVAADWRHPVTGRSVAEMLAALPDADRAEVVALP